MIKRPQWHRETEDGGDGGGNSGAIEFNFVPHQSFNINTNFMGFKSDNKII